MLAFVPVLLATVFACQNRESHQKKFAPQAEGQTASVAKTAGSASPRHAPLVGERVEVPTGAFEAGSMPGTEGRKPQIEQLATTVDLGPFQIDRLPFPNDPARAPLTNVTRSEAITHCASQGARLCTELEWERACKGPKSELFSTGERFELACLKEVSACASGFDVLGMGLSLREFTASDVVSDGTGPARGASVRGANAAAPKMNHRCAHREAVDENERAEDLGFRCCHGAPNAARVEEPHQLAVFERAKLDAPAVTALLATHPRTAPLAKDFAFFREPEAAETVVSRGPGDKQGLRFTVAPLYWSPVAGTRYLLIVGRSGKDTSAVLAYYVIREGNYRLAASFIMQSEPGPVALAYHESIRPRLFFSTCWKCPGETGKVLYREPDTIAIVQP